MKTPQVSIILPVYNTATYVAGAIKSVLSQSFLNFELIIINDGSIDNSLEIIKSFNDNRIRVINNNQNIGLQKTLNKALTASSGKYIARIDADDEWVNVDKLSKQIEFLEKNNNYVLIGTGVIVVNKFNKEILRFLNPQTDKKIRNNILGRCLFVHSSVVFRKNIVISIGGYSENPKYKYVEDYQLWLEMGKYGKFFNLSEFDVKYRTSQNQISSKNNREQIIKSLRLIKKYRNNYPGYYRALIRSFLSLIFYVYLKLNFLKKITAFLKRKLN